MAKLTTQVEIQVLEDISQVLVENKKLVQQASKTFEKLEEKAKKSGGDIGQALTAGLTAGLSGAVFLKLFDTIGAGLKRAFGASLDVIRESTEEFEKLEASLTALNAVAARTGTTGLVPLVEKSRAVTSGMVDLGEAARSVQVLLSAGIGADDAVKALDAFADQAAFGRLTAVSLSEAINSLARGVASGETELLKSVGIFVKLDDAIKPYADSLGKTTDQLTQTERRQALFNAVIAQTSRAYGDLDRFAATAEGSSTRLASSVNSLQQEIGEALSPAMVAINNTLAITAQRIGAWVKANKEVIKQKIKDVLRGILDLLPALAQGFGLFAKGVLRVVEAGNELRGVWQQQKLKLMTEDLRLLNLALVEMDERGEDELPLVLRGGQAPMINATREAIEAEIIAVRDAMAANRDNIKATEDYARKLDELEGELRDYTAGLVEGAKATRDTGKAALDASHDAEESGLSDNLDKAAENARKLKEEFERLAKGDVLTGGEVGKSWEAIQEAIDRTVDTTGKARELVEAQFEPAMQKLLTTALALGKDVPPGLTEMLKSLALNKKETEALKSELLGVTDAGDALLKEFGIVTTAMKQMQVERQMAGFTELLERFQAGTLEIESMAAASAKFAEGAKAAFGQDVPAHVQVLIDEAERVKGQFDVMTEQLGEGVPDAAVKAGDAVRRELVPAIVEATDAAARMAGSVAGIGESMAGVQTAGSDMFVTLSQIFGTTAGGFAGFRGGTGGIPSRPDLPGQFDMAEFRRLFEEFGEEFPFAGVPPQMWDDIAEGMRDREERDKRRDEQEQQDRTDRATGAAAATREALADLIFNFNISTISVVSAAEQREAAQLMAPLLVEPLSEHFQKRGRA